MGMDAKVEMDSEEEFDDLALKLEQILSKKSEGERKQYDVLVKSILDPDLPEARLISYLNSFRTCVHLLTREHETIVGVLLKINWISQSDTAIQAYIEFLTELVSSHTFYLKGCIKMLLLKFMPRLSAETNIVNINLSEYNGQFDTAHKALSSILHIVPTGARHLVTLISDMFPYTGRALILIESYVRNILHVTKYVPSVRERVIEIILDNLLKIDVEILKHEMEEDCEDDIDDTQFQVEMEDVNNFDATVDSEMKNEKAKKLDNLMLLIFSYIQETCQKGDMLNWEEAEDLYAEIMQAFQIVLLPTHASSHVQFVIFYMCSFGQFFYNSFLENCWQKVHDPNIPVILRQTAAAYIGSLIARAKFIPVETVKTCLRLFSEWIHNYINLLESYIYPDLHRHATFYSVCQTLFYVFIFRHKQLMDDPDWRNFVRKLSLDRIVTCRLNPLNFCLGTVVDMFARVTRMHEIVFCYTIIEHNRRMQLPGSDSIDSTDAKARNILDSFFPFDPYLLRKSSKFITPIYQEWEGIEDESLSEGHGENNDDEQTDEFKIQAKSFETGITFSVSPVTPRFDLCVSPGFIPELLKTPAAHEP